MITGGPVEGQVVSDPRSVIRFEHRIATAKALRCKAFFLQAAEEGVANPPHAGVCIEAILYRGDATHQQVVEKSKVHVSLVACAFFPGSVIDNATGVDGNASVETLAAAAALTKTMCDLQPVTKGTGDELYNIVTKAVVTRPQRFVPRACLGAGRASPHINVWLLLRCRVREPVVPPAGSAGFSRL